MIKLVSVFLVILLVHYILLNVLFLKYNILYFYLFSFLKRITKCSFPIPFMFSIIFTSIIYCIWIIIWFVSVFKKIFPSYKNNELVLWEYKNCAIYSSNKNNPISSEYFIWFTPQIITRARKSLYLYIEGTFHHPSGYAQLLIIIFKDIITSKYLPGFFILMSNKTEILYNIVFSSVKYILTQNNVYKLQLITITTDTEIALINSINNNFENVQRIGCWFHLKQDLIRKQKF